MDRIPLGTADLDSRVRDLHPDWQASTEALVRSVQFPSFLAAVRFIDELAPVAERLDHHPDLALSWRTVQLTLSTHSAGGVTELDIVLAQELDVIAAQISGPAG